ncbi:DUF6804 family protein [Bosea sp. EC-HK365B]
MPIALLLLALVPWPYAYYQMLRIVVCAAAGYLAYGEYQRIGLGVWAIILAVLALVFNPVAPLHMKREIWAILNIGTAAALAMHFWVSRRRSVR